MRPLSLHLPKVLCPVGNRPLIDHALDRLAAVTASVAVNTHRSQPTLAHHLRGRAHVSVEAGEALGTAGGVAALRDWIGGRPTVVVNGDTWCPGGLDALLAGWDGERIRVLVPGGGPFGPRSPVAGTLLPWTVVRGLAAEPTGLWEVCWRQALGEGRLESIGHDGPFVDCGSPAQYLTANRLCRRHRGVDADVAASARVTGEVRDATVGEGARIDGIVEDTVVWPGGQVATREHLRGSIRIGARTTVMVRGGA